MPNELPTLSDPLECLRNRRPIIDVRAPIEFAQGAVPTAINLPILEDVERAQVGTCFKEHGQDAAIALGHKLVSGDTRVARIARWIEAATDTSVVSCWRGGLRSKLAQQWLAEAGCSLERLDGGYKALRQTCLATLESAAQRPLIVIAGRTGTGKTQVIKALADAIDLEGRANHRGSAFGSHRSPQPSPAHFENALAVDLLQFDPRTPIAVEDESRTIGRLAVPERLFERMQSAPIAMLEADLSERIENIYAEYVVADANPDNLLSALDRIQRRLGGKRHQQLSEMMRDAFASDDRDKHHTWIERLLVDYYDPMYDYQIEKKKHRTLLTGDRRAIIAFVNNFRPA